MIENDSGYSKKMGFYWRRQKQTKTDKKQIETAEEEISAVKFYLIEF